MAKTKIQKLDKEMELLESQWNAELFKLYGQPPELLYHYTNTDGLLGILNSNTLWCSNSTFLNDASELAYALDVVSFQIDRKKKEYNNPIFTKILENLFSFYNGMFESYIVCFSEEGDLLSQWRAYGEGGNGYAIGFDATQVQYLKPFSAFGNAIIRKVEYNLERQMGLVGYILDGIYSLFERMSSSLRLKEDVLTEKFVLCLSWLFADLVLFFKHPSFAEEKEWRIIHLLSPHVENHNYFNNLEFRSTCGRIVPFVELNLFPPLSQYPAQLPIVKLVHGPTLNPDLTKKSIELLKIKHGFNNVLVEGSTVPIRI